MMTGNEMILLRPMDSCLPRFLSAGHVLHEFDSLATYCPLHLIYIDYSVDTEMHFF